MVKIIFVGKQNFAEALYWTSFGIALLIYDGNNIKESRFPLELYI